MDYCSGCRYPAECYHLETCPNAATHNHLPDEAFAHLLPADYGTYTPNPNFKQRDSHNSW